MPTQIKKITKVYFPMEEAVKKAADQNMARDQRLGLLSNPANEGDVEIYTAEAEEVLKKDGENYLPEAPDHEHICVQR